MKRIILMCICFAVLLPIGMSSPGHALPALTTVPGLGENIFGIGCAMGWAELRALNDDPPPAIIEGFRSLRDISRSVGYPPEIINEFDSILRRFHEGAASRQMYPDIRNLRVRMQQLSATLFTCGRTWGGGDVRTSLDGLRWQIPCGAGGGTYYCDCQDPAPVSTVLEGPTGTTYDVTLRFRGVVELKSYSGGKNDGSFWQEGGAPGSDPYNIYRLEISSPYQTYYLNRGTSGLEYTFLIDYTKNIRMAVGATVTLTAQAVEGYEIRNRDNSGNPIVVNGVPPAPGYYNGQFIQMDVVDVTIVRGY